MYLQTILKLEFLMQRIVNEDQMKKMLFVKEFVCDIEKKKRGVDQKLPAPVGGSGAGLLYFNVPTHNLEGNF